MKLEVGLDVEAWMRMKMVVSMEVQVRMKVAVREFILSYCLFIGPPLSSSVLPLSTITR